MIGRTHQRPWCSLSNALILKLQVRRLARLVDNRRSIHRFLVSHGNNVAAQRESCRHAWESPCHVPERTQRHPAQRRGSASTHATLTTRLGNAPAQAGLNGRPCYPCRVHKGIDPLPGAANREHPGRSVQLPADRAASAPASRHAP